MTRRQVAALVHDVGKYVARTARNLAPGVPMTPPLVAMLRRDLYCLGGPGRADRASAVFARLAAPLAALVDDPRLAAAARLLAEIDALEPALADAAAVHRAAAAAREIEALLRALARDLAASPGDPP